MKIVCPECGFAREVPEEKIPSGALNATCPVCKHRFRFREPGEMSFDFDQKPPEAPPAEKAKAETPGRGDIWDKLESMGEQAADRAPEKPGPVESPPKPPRETPPAPKGRRQKTAPRASALDAFDEKSSSSPWDSFETEPDPGEAPFERTDVYGFFGGLAKTFARAAFKAPSFFKRLPLDRSQGPALGYYLFLTYLLNLGFFIFVLLTATFGSSLESTLYRAIASPGNLENDTRVIVFWAAMMFGVLPLVSLISLYLFSLLDHLFLKLFKAAKARYNDTFRVYAYGSSAMLFSAASFLSIFGQAFPGARRYFTIFSLAVQLLIVPVWILAVQIIGYSRVHRAGYHRVVPAILLKTVLLLAVFALLFYIAFNQEIQLFRKAWTLLEKFENETLF